MSAEALKAAMAVFRADLYDTALKRRDTGHAETASLGTFAGPDFDPADIDGYLASFSIGWRPSDL
jgi:NitT/TauT family transport system ATP-binding protein